MRLRVTLTLFALVALALFLAGSVSLLLVRHAQSNTAQQALENQARTLARNPQLITGDILPVFQQVAGFSSVGTLVVQANGAASPMPPDVPISLAQGRQLLAGKAIVTSHNHLALAAATYSALRSTHVAVALYLESRLDFPTDNIWYFLTAGGVALLVVAGVASVVSQRISQRVAAVAHAARRIAAGDLATRVSGLEGRTYPELRELDTSINTMAADLERAQQGEREFLMAISHEFRTPLTSIRGYSEAITENAVEDPALAAAVVVTEADRLDRLIGDLLDLARLRARQFALDFGDIDAVAVVRQASEALRYAFVREGLELVLDMPEARPIVRADYHRLGQIITNLIENARKFAHHRVEVSVLAGEQTIAITVRDDGPGISPEDLPFIFDRLFKSDRYSGRTSGSGLGLAIVAELTAAMQATVTVRSPLGPEGGTEMTVHFPLSSDHR